MAGTLTDEQVALMTLRGMIASAPQEEQDKVANAFAELRELVSRHGDAAKAAVACLTLEFACEA